MSASYDPPNLRGKVALVTGATRGTGRGMAVAMGEAGATVYCTGRSSRLTRRKPRSVAAPGSSSFDLSFRLETIEETAERVTERGGTGISVVVDHSSPTAVQKLLQRIEKEQGKLDILVNDIWGGDALLEFGKAFWELDLHKGFQMMEGALHTHIITSHFAGPLLIQSAKESESGLIVEVTDGNSYQYRGNFFYDLVKTTVIRMAFILARELRNKNVAAIALTPGFVRSEVILDQFGVTEANWMEAARKRPDFAESETPIYSGRAVANLAADSRLAEKSGRVFGTWELADEYGFCDLDGRKPNWGKYVEKKYGDTIKPCDEDFYEYWKGGMMDAILANWP
jgi:NAD(P)-dependent dehydrogenase (short-subunit alcohol dehydrogenase family)